MAEFEGAEQHDTLPGVRAPVSTSSVFGHEKRAALLASSYQTGRLHHALMFEGPVGIGKASLAFLLAQHLIANPRAVEAPSNLMTLAQDSDDFRQLVNGTHLQVLHLTRPFDPKTEKFKTMVTVDEIRRINHFLSRTNTGAGYRVVIIDPINDMNANAANALLKNLEEPSGRTLFILIAHSAGRILPTVRSRCQIVHFSPLSDDDLKQAASKASVSTKISDTDLNRLTTLAEGGVRRALMLIGFGGLDVTDTADKLIAESVFDIDKAGKLGDAMMSREADIQYQLLTDHLLQRIVKAALRHGYRNDSNSAETMARFYGETRQMLVEAQAFNLDRKQTIFGLISALRHKTQAGLL